MATTTMFKSLLVVDRQRFFNEIQTGLTYTAEEAFAKDNHYTLFRAEDLSAWITFSVAFAFLLAFDTFVLGRSQKTLTMVRAVLYTMFWICMACAFCGWVYYTRGMNAAFSWMSGYMLEWMLSFDNLFVFHMIFQSYATPNRLKHKPLFYGICGAVFFRLVFIFIGEYLMHAMFFMHLVFGAFLVYTGIKTVAADDEDEDPAQHPLVQWLTRKVPFVSAYDTNGRFFVRVAVDQHGEVEKLPAAEATEADPLADEASSSRSCDVVDFGAAERAAVANGASSRLQWRATMLVLVVVCLELSDLLFAVDSVSAIVAQVPDLFLAYTSTVFAMLGLRATFFIIDVLVELFSLLKYGVAAVLVFVGVKLMLSRVYHIPPSVVCIVLVTSLCSAMIASKVKDIREKALKNGSCEVLAKSV